MSKPWSLRVVGMLVVLLASGSAGAEAFVDVYLGNASTEDARVRVQASAGGVIARSTARSSFDDSLVGGLRAGYWIDPAPWLGFAVDASAFAPDEDVAVNGANIAVLPLSALLLVRAPIGATGDAPGGRFQPYAGIGPSLFVSAFQIDVPPFGDVTAVTADFGLDLRAGLRVLPIEWLAVFVEYRYTSFQPDWSDSLSGIDVDIRSELRTHHVNAGIGFHF